MVPALQIFLRRTALVLIPNPPDALSGELEDGNRTVNVHGNEGVSGQDAGVL
jgi:hypothetical protein